MKPVEIVTVHGREIKVLADLPHGSLALTLETSRGPLAVILDRTAVSVVTREGYRMKREART